MARLVESVVGHEKQVELLRQMRLSQRWPHALLLVGPSGSGKKRVALACAQALVCENSVFDWGCGRCGPCIRIEKQQSESLTLLTPDRSMARPNIKVEQIRTLLEELSLKAIGKARIVIVDDAHLMNAQAANALLKELEEPSENVYFILIASDLHQLIATIRSRLQVVRFSALSYEEIKKIKPGCADWVYRSSRGRVDTLQTLSQDDGVAEREESLQLLDQFCGDENFLQNKSWKDSVKDRAWALRCATHWQQLVRDTVLMKIQAQNYILNTDQKNRLAKLQLLPMIKLIWLFERLVQAERDLAAHADGVLTFEDMWVNYVRLD